MAHQLLDAAKRKAETLSRYCIKPAGSGVILWRFDSTWMAVHHFPNADAAEDFLCAKLPKIGDA